MLSSILLDAYIFFSYLVAFKPPAKNMAADALEDLWNNCKFYIFSYLVYH